MLKVWKRKRYVLGMLANKYGSDYVRTALSVLRVYSPIGSSLSVVTSDNNEYVYVWLEVEKISSARLKRLQDIITGIECFHNLKEETV